MKGQGRLRGYSTSWAGNVVKVFGPDNVLTRWRINSFYFQIVCDATVATRYLRIDPHSSGVSPAVYTGAYMQGAAVTAGNTGTMEGGQADPRGSAVFQSAQGWVLNGNLWVCSSGPYLNLSAVAGVAGDTLTFACEVEEFID